MDEQRQNDQLEPIYSCSVLIQDIALKTSQEQWTIETGGERGSGRSLLATRRDDDDEQFLNNSCSSLLFTLCFLYYACTWYCWEYIFLSSIVSCFLFHYLLCLFCPSNCCTNRDCLSSTEFLIFLICPWMYSICSFWYVLVLLGFLKFLRIGIFLK